MKKWICGLVAVCLTGLLAVPVFAALPSGTGVITSSQAVSGSEFSSKSSIAKKLDKMFAGDIGLYKDYGKTELVDASLGTRNVPNNEVYQYWGPAPRAGTSCFAYANAFYGHFYDGVYPHHSLNSNHEKVKATGKITYQNLVKWGVRSDAVVYIREGNHSVVVLHYDENYITYADGNGDGKGLIAIRKEAWKDGPGTNIYNQKPSLIVQPTTAYFPAGSMNSKGSVSCTQGGSSHDWDKGTVTVKATCKETGVRVYTCLDCGKTQEETVKKTSEHTYGDWSVATETSCTKAGKKVAVCTLCGKEKTAKIKALGHAYGKTEVVQEGSIYAPGITQRTCQRCAAVKTIKSECIVTDADFGITLITREGVFPKKTQFSVTGPEDPEAVKFALRGVSAKALLFVLNTAVKETPVQPDGTVTLEIKIPQDFSNNLGLYQVTDGEAVSLPSTIDPETGILTAQLQSFEIFALCDLNIPWRPERTEATEPVTEPTTAPATEPVTEPAMGTAAAAVAAEDQPVRDRTLILLIAVAAGLAGIAVTVTSILLVRSRKKRQAEAPQAEAPAASK